MKKQVFHTPQEILQMFKDRGLPENFCIVPFTNLIFNPGGRISVCRQKGTDHSIGHLNQESLVQIWNNKYIQSWRQELLSGKVKICDKEQKREACHLSASNYHFFDEVFPKIDQELKLLKITANFNGHCNLQCTMCHIWKMENGYYDKEDFWNNSEKDFFPFIKEIELLSGEPFIQKDTYKLIDKVSNVNSDCQWAFTTNAHWSLNSAVKKYLDKIHVKNIIISVDSLEPQKFEEIRKGGSLQKLQKTVDDLVEYEKERVAQGKTPLGLTIHFTAMRNNFLEALDIITYCEQNGLRHSFKTLITPEHLSVTTLPYEEQKALLKEFISRGEPNQVQKAMRVARPLTEVLTPIDKAEIFYLMQNKLKSLVTV